VGKSQSNPSRRFLTAFEMTRISFEQLGSPQEVVQRGRDILQRGLGDGIAPDQHQVIAGERVQEPAACRFAHQALGPISRDGAPDLFADHESHARLFQTVRPGAQDDERVRPGSSLLPHTLHVGSGFEPPRALDTHLVIRRGYRTNFLARLTPTVRRMRPLARRAFKTLRPPLVCILFRKPCTRKRCRRLG
jgi:hypothetical protein